MWGRCLTTAVVVAAFHRRRVLPLMARRRRLFEMAPDESIDGIRLSAVTLSDEEILHRVKGTVDGWTKSNGLSPFLMHPSWGYISLASHAPLWLPRPSCSLYFPVPLLRLSSLQGMRDVRASPPPVPEDAGRRAKNRAYAEVCKKRKDAKEARRNRKILEREELEKHRQQQRCDGLPEEPSPSSSSLDPSSDDDDEVEAGRGPLNHLPDVREQCLGHRQAA